MLNVVQIVVAALPGPNGARGVNGPELRALNSLAWADTSRIRTTIVYPRTGRLWQAFADTGVDLVDFEIGGKFAFRSVARLSEILRSRGAHVVHTQGSGVIDLFGCLAARRSDAVFVLTRPVMIEDLPISRARRFVYMTIDRFTLMTADAVIAVSQDGFDRLATAGVERQRLRLIYNGIDLGRFADPAVRDRRKLGLESDALVIGACAQLTATKAWTEFLSVVQELHARMPQVRGLVVGDGPLREYLEAECRKRGIQGIVTFAGFMRDVSIALHCMDVYLSMSKAEGLSVGLIEALAAGLPAVVTDVGGSREQVVSGASGFVVRPGDTRAAVSRVAELLLDPDLRSRMGAEGRARAYAMFDVSRMVKQYEQVYEAVAAADRTATSASNA